MAEIRVYRITSDDVRLVSLPEASSLDAATRQLPPGLYTTFRTFENRQRVLGLRLHLRRLYGPTQQKGIRPAVAEERLRREMAKLLSNIPCEARVRPILTFQGEMYLVIEPFSPLPSEVYKQGVNAMTVALHRLQPELKVTGFIEASQQARQRIQESGAFEALMVWRGRILEGLTSNFFYVQNGQLGTAGRGVLPGVTRRLVLRLARCGGEEVRFAALPVRELSHIEEAFLTSSSRGIVPIVQIDGIRVGEGQVGKITRRLMAAYEAHWQRYAEPLTRESLATLENTA